MTYGGSHSQPLSLSNTIWTHKNLNNIQTECTQIFTTRGGEVAITLILSLVADKDTCLLFVIEPLFLSLSLSLLFNYFAFTFFFCVLVFVMVLSFVLPVVLIIADFFLSIVIFFMGVFISLKILFFFFFFFLND